VDLEDLRTAMHDRLGTVPGATSDTSTDAAAADALMTRLINRALQDVALRGLPTGWDWLHGEGTFSTVAGTDKYTFAQMTAVSGRVLQRVGPLWVEYDGIRTELEVMPWRAVRTVYETAPEGLPEAYAVKGREILVAPVPDAVYTIRYRFVQNEPTLGANGIPLMPEQFQEAIVERACQLWFRRVGNLPMAAACAAEFQTMVSVMRHAQRPYAGPGHVDDVMYG
jgi:hypothetical protein